MRNKAFFFFTALAVLLAVRAATAQKFLPKTIQFKGAPEYSDQELMDAAGLKKGIVLDYADMNDRTKQLLATGMFATLAFQFNGQDLVFTLTPNTDLYPVRLINLPLSGGKELDDNLHKALPLYHGKVPADGGMTDGVCRTLEAMLSTQSIKASVLATPYTDPVLHKVTAISFSVMTPSIEIGPIHLDSTSPALDPKAEAILAKIPGSPYDIEGSPSQIAAGLGSFYQNEGYLETEVHATPQAAITDSPDAVRIPFVVSFNLGKQYRILGVQLAPDLIVSQADFDHQSHIHPGDIADGAHVVENWQFIARQYHNHGFAQAQVQPTPSFDREKGTVTYTVTVVPGPVYTMGALTIQNVSDQLRTAMLAEWKMPAGATFNEGAILSFYATQTNLALKSLFSTVNCKYNLTLNQENHTVDVALRLEKR